MKHINLAGALLALSCFSIDVHAEGNCPPGSYPIGGRATAACAPIPGNGGQQQAPRAPEPVWEDRWGAMATDEPRGVLGAVTGYPNEQTAQQAALSDCKAKGGINCTLTNSYRNGCIALTVSDSSFYYGADSTIDIVAFVGMLTCIEAGKKN